MGKPYADDLRGVAVRLIGEGHTRVEIAELCGISLIRVKIWFPGENCGWFWVI